MDGTGEATTTLQSNEEIRKDMEKRQIVICRNIEQVKEIYEKQNIMKGQKSIKEQKEMREREAEGKEKEIEPIVKKIPDDIFSDFKDLQEGSLDDDLFDYIAFNIVIAWLEICIYGK